MQARFAAKWPWWGGDLQTLRNTLSKPAIDLSQWPPEERLFTVTDGTGDQLGGKLHLAGKTEVADLMVIVHGLGGCEDSYSVLHSTRYFLSQGLSVLRLNLRGALPYRHLAQLEYNAGRSEDLFDVHAQLREQGFERIAYFGTSLGANQLLKFAGEAGELPGLSAIISVCAPIDLKQTQERFMHWRNHFYQRYMLGQMKRGWLSREGRAASQIAAIEGARTVYEFDDKVVAVAHGYASAEDYYSRCSGQRFLSGIKTPCLVIHSANDPWIPMEPYMAFDWSINPSLKPLFTNTGGHCGFHEARQSSLWSDRAAWQFLQAG